MEKTEEKNIRYATLILTNDNRIRIPQKMIEKLEIPNRSLLEIYEFEKFIIIQKPIRPDISDLTSRYLELKEAIKIINAKRLLTKKKHFFEEIEKTRRGERI